MNVLFTCAGRRNYLIQYFKEIIGNRGKTIAVDSDPTAPAFADADLAIRVPSLFDTDYVETLLAIVRDNRVDLVIPLNDIELPIMAAHKEKLEAYGAKVIVSRLELIDLCADKWKTYNFFEDLKIPTPKTFIRIEDALWALAENSVTFPMILKPRWGFGSVGIEEVETEEELRSAYRLLWVKINKTLMAGTDSKTLKNQIIFQEKIDGEEYGMDIVNDFNGNFQGSYARKKWAMRGGETDKAISVVDSRFSGVAEKIGNATHHIGNMDCDFFLKDGKIYFLEMNPRFGGGYPFSHAAGVNIPAMYVEWWKGNSEVSRFDEYRPDLTFSKCERIVSVGDCKPAVLKKLRMTV